MLIAILLFFFLFLFMLMLNSAFDFNASKFPYKQASFFSSQQGRSIFYFFFLISFCCFTSTPLRKPLVSRRHAINAAHLQRVLLVLAAPAQAAVERAGLPGGRVVDGGLAGGGGVLGVVGLGLLGCENWC
jgi:hypothetical protein